MTERDDRRLWRKVSRHRAAASGAAAALALAAFAVLAGRLDWSTWRANGTDGGEPGGVMSEEIEFLEPGRLLEHRLEGGTSRAYGLRLESDQFVSVSVEQRGIDVVLRLYSPAGDLVTEIDSPTGASGFERVREVAAEPGVYRLEVCSFDQNAAAGPYGIALEGPRPATQEDRSRVAAERAFAEAEGLRRKGDHAAALPPYGGALEAWRSIADREGEAVALYRIGWMHHALEDRRRALDFYRPALELYRDLGDRAQEAVVSTRIGRALLLLGHHEEAAASHQRALELFRELGDTAGEASSANHLGHVDKWAGRTEEALRRYEHALALWERLGDHLSPIGARLNIGDVYLARNDLDAARHTLERALEDARAADDAASLAACLLKLGETLDRGGRLEEAAARLEEALEVQRERRDRRGEALVMSALGTVRLKSGGLDAARQAFEGARATFQELADRQGEAMTLHKLGRYHFARGDLARALESHRAALPLFEASGDRQGSVSTRYGAARALHDLGRHHEAREVLEAVLEDAQDLRSESESHELRASYLASRRHYWELYVSTLMALHDGDPASRYDLVALQATERWRARGLLDLLAEAGVELREGAPPELLTRERELRERLAALERHRLELANDPGESVAAAALEEGAQGLLIALDRARSELRSRSYRYAQLTDPDPLDLARIQGELLGPDTLLLVYFLGVERSFLWTVSHAKVESYPLAGRETIESAARDYYELLPKLASRTESAREEAGVALSRAILGPAARWLASASGKGRLVVVADGALHYLPFAALPVPTGAEGDGSSGLLLDRFDLVHLPSASVLGALRRLRQDRKRAPRTVAVVADPVFEADDVRIRRATARRAADDPRLREAVRALGPAGFERLDHTETEADAIVNLAPAGSSFKAVGFAADRSLLEDGTLQDYRILHFATHGLVHRERPALSGLVLSLFDETGEPRPGFLRLPDIYNLRLRPELVVLSACETGLGREVEGEGLVGLTRGFMYAGAPRVVHSLWKVGDEATAELMKRFYSHLFTGKLAPAAALAAAQRSMRVESQWHEPFHWAGFVFQGDWQGTSRALDDDIEGTDTGGGGDPGEGLRGVDDLPPPNEDVPRPEPPPVSQGGGG